MLEKHDVRRNRNGRAGGAQPPFSAPARRSGKPEAAAKGSPSQTATARGLNVRRYFTARATTASRTSSGSSARPPSPARTASRCSSSVTSRCPRAGRRRRRTSSCRSTSAARSARPSASARCASSSRASPTRSRTGGRTARRRLLRERGVGARVQRRAQAPARRAEDGLQLARLVQRRQRGGAAVLGVLHQQRRRHDGVDPRPREDRGHAVQVRLGHGHEPLAHPLAKELLNGGGTASGPVSFMRGFDAFAGVIKSGGKTRRAAKMVMLDIDHPDIEEFIWCKAKEEKKAWTLIDAGYDGSFDGEAYKSVFFQNSNNSVRVSDDFMEAVQKDRDWSTRAVRDGRPVETLQGARPVARHRRGGLAVRRSGPAVRHDDQRLAHVVEDGAHQRLEPLQRVHVPRRLGLQPGVAEPAQVRARHEGRRGARRRRVRRELVPPRRRARRSWRRRSSSGTPSTRRRGSPRTRTGSGRSASATPTWARCSCRAGCRTTAPRRAPTRAPSRRS